MSVVESAVTDRVARITLNRPERGDGINRADATIGYPPARVWGSPTTAMWASRIGAQRAKRAAVHRRFAQRSRGLEWGLAIEAPPASELEERAEASRPWPLGRGFKAAVKTRDAPFPAGS